jgi:hypothetical protein
VHQAHVTAGAVCQGADRGLVHPADDQVAFPVPDPLPPGGDRGPVVDQHGRGHEPDLRSQGCRRRLRSGGPVRSGTVSCLLSPPFPP